MNGRRKLRVGERLEFSLQNRFARRQVEEDYLKKKYIDQGLFRLALNYSGNVFVDVITKGNAIVCHCSESRLVKVQVSNIRNAEY